MSYESAKALMSKSVSRPTLYSVQLPTPVISQQVNDYLNFFVKEVTIPEVRTQTIVANGHDYMGIVREQPTNILYGKPLTMTVIENSDFMVYKAMRGWFDRLAVNTNQSGAIGDRTLRMNYYDTYTHDIEIQKLEQPDTIATTTGSIEANANYKKPIKVKFINAYPVNVGQISLASDAYDAMTTFSLSFTYESYTVIDSDQTIGQLVNGATDLLNMFR